MKGGSTLELYRGPEQRGNKEGQVDVRDFFLNIWYTSDRATHFKK